MKISRVRPFLFRVDYVLINSHVNLLRKGNDMSIIS